MKISIPRKVYEVDLGDQVVTIRRPTVALQDEYVARYTEALKDDAKEKPSEVVFWMLEQVGLSKEVAMSLDLDQLNAITELVTMGEIKKK